MILHAATTLPLTRAAVEAIAFVRSPCSGNLYQRDADASNNA